MSRLYQTKIWQVQLPDAWSVRDGCGQEFVTFFRPDGVGMLTVITAEEKLPVQEGRSDNFHGRLTGTSYTNNYGDKFNRIWTLSCRGKRLWVRYTCSAKNAEQERLEVDEILENLEEAS